jgi:hypothetical protein
MAEGCPECAEKEEAIGRLVFLCSELEADNRRLRKADEDD